MFGLLQIICKKLVQIIDKGLLCQPILNNVDTQTDGAYEAPRRRPTRGRPPNLRLESDNPLYEGAMYEVTPGESLKTLSFVPTTPSAEASTRYMFDMAPQLPPPRKLSVCQSTSKEFNFDADTVGEKCSGIADKQE